MEKSSKRLKCPICNSQTSVISNHDIEMELHECEQCGRYQYFPNNSGVNSRNKHLIAGYLFETYRDAELCKIDMRQIKRDIVDNLLQSPLIPKTSMQKLDKILLNLYKSGNGFTIEFDSNELAPAIGYAKDSSELGNMLHALRELEYIKYTGNVVGGKEYTITIKGLERAESLLTEQNFSKRAFIAMRFSDDLKEVRDESIKPACEACGFEAYTVDEEEHIEDITDKIISGIKTSRFVIADFTYNNPGVYYEAGYAKGLGIPVIKTCKKEWFESVDENGEKNRLHFDVEHDNMIMWENVDDLRRRLEARIQAVIL